jgi:dTDP-4-dehydrorhamnose 3,5-epimerase
MRFLATDILGAFIVVPTMHVDARGSFSRVFCETAFATVGIAMRAHQMNVSRNARARTLRGLHYQASPHAEAKLVQCLRGRLWDVALDLRPASPSHGRAVGVDLSAADDEKKMFFIPPGCAHGFLTLADDTDLIYVVDAPFVAEAERGVRWNDPRFGIAWPATPEIMSERDAHCPDFLPDFGPDFAPDFGGGRSERSEPACP